MWGVEGYILRGGIKQQIYSGPRILCGLSVRKEVGWKGRKVKKGGEKREHVPCLRRKEGDWVDEEFI